MAVCALAERCVALYRDVPLPEELKTTGNFISKVPPNAQELIDYALSHIPTRARDKSTEGDGKLGIGRRNSRQKKRMEHRRLQSVHDHQRRIKETVAAEKRKVAKKVRQVKLMKMYQTEAIKQVRKAHLAAGGSVNTIPAYSPINYDKYMRKREAFRLMRDKAKVNKQSQ